MSNKEKINKLPLKHPNQKRLDDAIEKLKANKKLPKKKKDPVLQNSYRKVKKEN